MLSHLGLELGRWRAVVWIVKSFPVDGLYNAQLPQLIQWSPWQDPRVGGLEALTETPIELPFENLGDKPLDEIHLNKRQMRHYRGRMRMSNFSIIDKEIMKDSKDAPENLYFNGLGQVWQSLGNMLLRASDVGFERSEKILPYILQVIAHLHHIGIMPQAVYDYEPNQSPITLEQPPTLKYLSTRILANLADATWRAQLSPAKRDTPGTEVMNMWPYPRLNHEVPGKRYERIQVTELGPEVWLELVLWSCLHGGWIAEGASVLAGAARSWTLVSWPEVVRYAQSSPPPANPPAWIYSTGQTGSPLKAKTLSTELVTSHVDALLNTIHVGVGERGTPPADVWEQTVALKFLLTRNSQGLGALTWDAVILRFLESQGLDVEQDPQMLESILNSFAQIYGSEVKLANAPTEADNVTSVPSYILDGSAVVIGLHHRLIDAYIQKGDAPAAFRVFFRLQELTDRNKQGSFAEFFAQMQRQLDRGSSKAQGYFDNSYTPIEFPSFFPQVPIPTIAALLELATETNSFEFGKWLLFSKEVDGPVIPRSLYSNTFLSEALINFAIASMDEELLSNVLQEQASAYASTTPYDVTSLLADTEEFPLANQKRSGKLHSAAIGMLQVQIARQKWKSVAAILDYLKTAERFEWDASGISSMVVGFLQLHKTSDDMAVPKEILQGLVSGKYGEINKRCQLHYYSLIFILSSIDHRWESVCRDLLPQNPITDIFLSAGNFNRVLSKIVQEDGCLKAIKLFDQWCESPLSSNRYDFRDGGIAKIAKQRPYPQRRSVFTAVDGQKIRGRVVPNVSTLLIIARSISQDERRLRPGETEQLLLWVADNLRAMGVSEEEIDTELGGILSRVN